MLEVTNLSTITKKFFSLHEHELLQHTDSHGVLVSGSSVVFVTEE